MKICIISTNIFALPVTSYSGLEHLAWLLAKGLAAKRSGDCAGCRKHEVTLIAPKGSTCPGVTIHETNLGETEHQAYRGYKDKLKNFDVIISHEWEKWSAVAKLEGLKPPVLLVAHAPIGTMYSSPPPYDKPCFVGISLDHAQSIKEHLRINCRVAYNGVDMDFYKPLGLKKNNRYLFLARFSSIKGADLAIKSCLDAQRCLDLVGDDQITNEPGYKESVVQACNANPQLLKFIGRQDRTACVNWFNTNCALLHLNQRFREPFGLAPVESQACGTPVIAWRNGAMPETIVDGETGFLVDTLEQATELVKTDAIKTIKPERCREWAATFSNEKFINRYEELCEEAIAGGW